MVEGSNFPRRDPKNTHAWLVGSGIASLTAAIHLIKDAKVPGANIHVLDASPDSGGGLKTHGDAIDGYFLPMDGNPHFHGGCVERLLSLIPSESDPDRSIMDVIRLRAEAEPKVVAPQARAVKLGATGVEAFLPRGIQVGIKHRMALVGLMLESETAVGTKSIEDVFDKSFFDTTFWMLWSTTFALKPCHSAAEFKRHLRKYLEDIQSLNSVKTVNRTRYNFFESAVGPLTKYLRQEDVDFRFNVRVTDLRSYPEGDPTTISEIELLKAGQEELITVDPMDIVLTPPPGLTANWEDLMEGDWKLWGKLSNKSLKFGDPANFLSRNQQSTVETFTTTFKGPEFSSLYHKLTHDRPGTGSLLSLTESAWEITISIPHQPIFSDQPENVTVMLGYGLNPMGVGNYVKKPMCECSGEEILSEVLSHLGMAAQPIISTAKTIPCGMPLATAPFLTRGFHSRSAVLPPRTTNVACVGQFVDIPGDTTLEVEYSVRGAQIAVAELMGLPEKPPKPPRSLLMEIFDLMV
ncbi:hypothetical protein AOCH_000118 [Aspergillus ochraceoroseus]|uniref:67 kDa myosin-cross-reactive antigen family protein n=1 Tax=Aspergillus ochraceoroseus TaxID=138278 RepID=A0A0F8VEC6_9EURO|nr:hypothetical protein AOCH_000118 [Aspergillus ochraceoroseus]